jgi:hypothetical protein
MARGIPEVDCRMFTLGPVLDIMPLSISLSGFLIFSLSDSMGLICLWICSPILSSPCPVVFFVPGVNIQAS